MSITALDNLSAPENIASARNAAVEALIVETRALLNADELDRYTLSQIQLELESLAAHSDLWDCDEFAEPNVEERQNRYLIYTGGDNDITLYLNVMRPGKKISPHDHTTWACMAAVVGSEFNTLYDRLDDGSVDGKAQIEEREVIELAPGGSVSLMPDDIHSVEIRGEDCIRHLHFYGRPLEMLTARKTFDAEAGTYRIMGVGVKTKS